MMIRHRIQLMEKLHKKYLNLIFFLELPWRKKNDITSHHSLVRLLTIFKTPENLLYQIFSAQVPLYNTTHVWLQISLTNQRTKQVYWYTICKCYFVIGQYKRKPSLMLTWTNIEFAETWGDTKWFIARCNNGRIQPIRTPGGEWLYFKVDVSRVFGDFCCCLILEIWVKFKYTTLVRSTRLT
jgi:hypothetical protein